MEGFWDYDLSTKFDPDYEVRESDTDFRMIFEVAGLKKEEIKVDIVNGVLRVSGERKAPDMKKGETCSCSGLGYGKFEKSFTLPDSVKEGEVHATYNEGLLELVIPKKEEVKAKAIEVKIE
jgi:HSP20 family protein